MEEAVRGQIQPIRINNEKMYLPQTQQICKPSYNETTIEMAPLEYNNNDHIIEHLPRLVAQRHEIDAPEIGTIRRHWKKFIDLLSIPTLILSLLQGAPGCIPWGIVNTYLNDFLAVDRNMSVQYATFVVLLFGVGNFFGMLVGGHGGTYLYRLDKRYPALLAGCAAVLGCFPFWMLLNGIDSHSSILMIVLISILLK